MDTLLKSLCEIITVYHYVKSLFPFITLINITIWKILAFANSKKNINEYYLNHRMAQVGKGLERSSGPKFHRKGKLDEIV